MSKEKGKEKGKKKSDKENEDKENKGPSIEMVSHPHFDLVTYINSYTGHTKISRLIFIAERCLEHQPNALKMAILSLKQGKNTSAYKEICSKVGSSLGTEFVLDQVWIDSTDKTAAQTQDRLEAELSAAKSALIRENIRMGHSELGDFYYERGDLNTSLKSYVRTRDYCTTSYHIIEMCLNVIKVSVEMGNFAHVINYVNKAEQTPDLTSQPIVQAKLKVCAGLAHLENRKYKLAAKKFLETGFEVGNEFSDVISQRDVAIYGALTSLATFERQELKSKVLDNREFKQFLELVPQVRELINDFYASRYASCLDYLEGMRLDLLLDIHLHDHLNSLYQKIRSKAMIQYFTPFTSVDMNTMANAFNTDITKIEKELQTLILEGAISARIDSHNKVLVSKSTNQRNHTFEKAIAMGEVYQLNTKAMLMRISLLRKDIVVRPPRERRSDRHKDEGSRKAAKESRGE